MALAFARTCADCGDVIDREHLSRAFERLLCLRCRRDEGDHVKRDAEVWLLERMFTTRSAA